MSMCLINIIYKKGKDNSGDNMKKKISYLVMSLLFFNVLFIFYYYFKMVNFFYINLFDYNLVVNIMIVNFIVTLADVLIMLFYESLGFNKYPYFLFVIIGCFIGTIISFVFLGLGSYEFSDYLSIVSFFTIDIVFIGYSLKFDEEKEKVFQ